jgi:putative IMPACT (imprinted ancient) family translation regulator
MIRVWAESRLRRFLSQAIERNFQVTYTLSARHIHELEIRKSRFIAYAIPVEDRDAAMDELRRLRDEHPAATHVCWALLAGTAGRPILEVLRHHDLDGVLAAVVRYYGGVKLGAGGLVRAYTDAIASALLDAPRVERIAQGSLIVEVGYADEAKVRRWIEAESYALADTAHAMLVKMTIRLPVNKIDDARRTLVDMTQGKAGFF